MHVKISLIAESPGAKSPTFVAVVCCQGARGHVRAELDVEGPHGGLPRTPAPGRCMLQAARLAVEG
eukprot:6940855-Lingulodinium_polyedra.AAC.1